MTQNETYFYLNISKPVNSHEKLVVSTCIKLLLAFTDNFNSSLRKLFGELGSQYAQKRMCLVSPCIVCYLWQILATTGKTYYDISPVPNFKRIRCVS